MEKNNSVKVGLNSSSEVLEVNYNWIIPKYKTRTIYSEKLNLRDDIECTIMLVPKIEDKRGSAYKENNRFARSYVTVFFTKVPDDDNRQVFFNFNIRTHHKRRPIATAGFKQVMMKTEGYRGMRNNLNSNVWRQCINKDFALDLDVKVGFKNTLIPVNVNSLNTVIYSSQSMTLAANHSIWKISKRNAQSCLKTMLRFTKIQNSLTCCLSVLMMKKFLPIRHCLLLEVQFWLKSCQMTLTRT